MPGIKQCSRPTRTLNSQLDMLKLEWARLTKIATSSRRNNRNKTKLYTILLRVLGAVDQAFCQLAPVPSVLGHPGGVVVEYH